MGKKKTPKEKIYKKGTVITFHSTCNFAGCDGREEVVLEENRTESSLNEEAYERALDFVQPEGWFGVGGDND